MLDKVVQENLNQGDCREAKINFNDIYPAFEYLQTVHSCVMAELETKLIHFNEFDEAQTLQFLVIQEQGIDFNIFIEEMQEICIQTQKAIIDLTNT